MKGPIGRRWIGLLAGVAAVVAGCERTTGARRMQPVGMHLGAARSVASGTAGSGAVEITSLRLVVGTASLGSGDQFGCVDCQGNYEEGPVTPSLIDVPLGGGTVQVATDQVAAGHYAQAEVSLESPTAATLAGVTGWASGATMEIQGRINGAAFTLPLTVLGSFREALTPPVDVTASQVPGTVAVTITLPVASWFVSNGTALDPSNAAQRAMIEANVRTAFQFAEPGGTGSEADARPEATEGR